MKAGEVVGDLIFAKPKALIGFAGRRVIEQILQEDLLDNRVCTQERPGLVVLMIELESALSQMPSNTEPTKMWSPYREPLARFLNKYPEEVLRPTHHPKPCHISHLYLFTVGV